MASLLALLTKQHQLQTEVYGHDLTGMDDETRATYVRDMVLALTHEAHEALDEVGWKPWASDRGVNQQAYLEELVDVLFFLLNLMLATGLSPMQLAQFVGDEYMSKWETNVERQAGGYAGHRTRLEPAAL